MSFKVMETQISVCVCVGGGAGSVLGLSGSGIAELWSFWNIVIEGGGGSPPCCSLLGPALLGVFLVVAGLLPWRLWSEVPWASLSCSGGSTGCWAVPGSLDPVLCTYQGWLPTASGSLALLPFRCGCSIWGFPLLGWTHSCHRDV